jgi:hypothetical protein
MDAFLSFHAPGFWLVIAVLAGVVALGVRPYAPAPVRPWVMPAYWGLIPYLALITGGVSPRWLGVASVDWRAGLTLGIGLALALVALAALVRVMLASGAPRTPAAPRDMAAAPVSELVTASVTVSVVVGLSGVEEWFWCFLRSAVAESLVILQLPLDLPVYWSIWIAALLALPSALLVQPTAYHRLVKVAILLMTSILFFYTRNFWLCWAVHAITWLLLAQPSTRAGVALTGKSRSPR